MSPCSQPFSGVDHSLGYFRVSQTMIMSMTDDMYNGFKYGLRLTSGEIVYVGVTNQSLEATLERHLSDALDAPSELNQWITENAGAVEIVDLGTVEGTWDEFEQADRALQGTWSRKKNVTLLDNGDTLLFV